MTKVIIHRQYDVTETDQFALFYGGPFSNFAPTPFEMDGLMFNTSEQAFMYRKAMAFGDDATARKILASTLPAKQKAFGRQVIGFDPEVWSNQSMSHMYDACYAKFSQNANYKELLFKFMHLEFVEASEFDRIWGIGLWANDERAYDRETWQGENRLGLVLNQVATTLFNEAQ
jgi:ribA/ribD-fused uncharacterized protein